MELLLPLNHQNIKKSSVCTINLLSNKKTSKKMKTSFNSRIASAIMFIAFLVSASSFAKAGGNDSVNTSNKVHHSLEVSILPKGDTKKFRVAFHNETQNPVVISVYDNKHKSLLHKMTLRNAEVGMKDYNLSRLPAGEYSIELNNSQEKYTQNFTF
jgi:hypothetical protein